MFFPNTDDICTCSRCSSDSVDVGLGKAGGVVVNDDLDSWNIQTPVVSEL